MRAWLVPFHFAPPGERATPLDTVARDYIEKSAIGIYSAPELAAKAGLCHNKQTKGYANQGFVIYPTVKRLRVHRWCVPLIM